jgi:U3 small nucleolar RNA-associated protein 20
LVGEIIMEDIFGVTGSEKDEEGFTTKMKEVKQHKSFDSGQILAKNISLSVFGNIIDPVKTLLLYSKVSLKMERNVEELLRRIAQGLYHNAAADSRDVLVMCYEMFRLVEREEEEKKERESLKNLSVRDIQQKQAKEHFTVRLDSRNWNKNKSNKNVENLHILIRFVMDTLRTVLGKNEQLMTAENLAAFVPMVDQGVTTTYEDVQIASLRLLAFIIKLPIPEMGPRMVGYGRRTLTLIKSCSSTNSELCQASLRLLSVMIRQKDEFSLNNNALAYILDRIKPDLEEPDRQGITFTFLKAVLSKHIVIPEVYDVMDRVVKIMVTNQSRIIRDTCRSTYFQFLIEYPQGEARLKKSFQFLVSNLEYPSYYGRLSVMELLHLIVTKIADEQIEELTTSLFVALVLVMINDDTSQCRENAAIIIKELFERLKDKQIELVEDYCLKWLIAEQPALARGGFQITAMFFEQFGTKKSLKLVELATKRAVEVLKSGRHDSAEEVPWELVYFALKLIEKLSRLDKSVFEINELWNLVEDTLLFPHAWVRLCSCRLIGLLYSQGSTSVDIFKTENLRGTAYKCLRQLGAPSITDELGIQIVKNLVFISRRWEKENVVEREEEGADEQEDEIEEDEQDDLEEQDEHESSSDTSKSPFEWLIRRVSIILRSDKDAHLMEISKRSGIQILASIIQIVSESKIEILGKQIIHGLYLYSVSEEEQNSQFKDLCIETLAMLEKKMGTTDYLHAYTAVRTQIEERRVKRRSQRAIQAVAEPELYHKRKMQKNFVKKEKRKRVKDINGYYQGKKRRT